MMINGFMSRRAKGTFAVATIGILGLTGLTIARAGPSNDAPPAPAGWTTTFSDDFSGPAGTGVDSQWTYNLGTGIWGTGEIETDTNSTTNVSEDGNGNLDITPVESGGSWTSGRIETASRFSAPAGGEMEVSASLEQPNPANGQGYWPAFWLLGAGGSEWPATGEIDTMESVNAQSQNATTFHCGTDPGGPCNEPNGIGSGLQPCPGCQTSFTTYSVIVDREVTNETITWYRNGTQTFQVSESQVGTSTWQAAVDNNGGFNIILNVAMGGGWPGNPTSSTTSGASMAVDYVTVDTTTG
jgi:beta-glucanase (GH16 family)